MIYATIISSMGMLMAYVAFHENLKVLYVVGIACFLFGYLGGQVIENRMEKRIKTLEDRLKETTHG